MHLLRLTSVALPAALLVGLALAKTDHGMVKMTAPEGATDATKGYVDVMNTMSMGMLQEFTGDADRDFILGMIAHHQGAVDAARVVLAHGTDPAVRAYAEAIIAAQAQEIAFMKDWLAKHPQ